ncbi:DNA-3-methyladenine glycosylase I [Haploplasma axanthum]|nr:DNA-3-methyladenine glycosylase I [Haploplasma axanthum]
MNIERCSWANTSEYEMKYHDNEWGVPTYDDKVLFEFLILEGQQAGLSWQTILKRREGMREAYYNFDPERLITLTDVDIEKLLKDNRIIKNRLKVNSVVNNAKCYFKVIEEYGSLSNFLWSFVDGKPVVNHYKTISEVPASTQLSDQISKELKKIGFKFVGSTIIYAFMQAVGMVNDHLISCFRHSEV